MLSVMYASSFITYPLVKLKGMMGNKSTRLLQHGVVSVEYNIRDLKIPRRDELGRLPEVNLLNRACARELSTHLSGVLVSSRTTFRRFSRRIENVSILRLFCPDNCSNRLYFHLHW